MIQLVQKLWEQMRSDLGADLSPQVNQACRSLLEGACGPLSPIQIEDMEAIQRSLAKLDARFEGEPIDWADHSVATHALRGPLNSVIGFSRLLIRGVDGPTTEEQNQALEIIYRGSRRMLLVFNLLLDALMLEQEDIIVSREVFPVQELLDELSKVGQALADKQGFVFLVETAQIPPDLHIHSDKARLKQTLAGLFALLGRYVEQSSITLSVWLDIEAQLIGVELLAADCQIPQAAIDDYPQLLTAMADFTIPYDVHLRLGLARELLIRLGGRLDLVAEVNSLVRLTAFHPTVY